MLNHEFDRQNGILYVTPVDRLDKDDFVVLAAEIDPYLSKNGKLRGLVVTANQFPFWKDFEGMISHFKFVRDHHRKIEKVAIVTDDSLANLVQAMTKHFVKAQVKVFKTQDRDLADTWVKESSHKAAS